MKVLAAVEDSVGLDTIVARLIEQMKPEATEVRVLHVVDPFPVALAERLGSRERPDFEAARARQEAESTALLDAAAAALRTAGFSVSFSIAEGDVRTTILDEAQVWGADLIVIGTHGHGGLHRLLHRSVSDAVAHGASCAVEIVPVSTDQS